ncbi:MAG TPA: prolipoprotein diacylglyceryl transferase [Deltaproteobacteria bacterium]|nr:prolipoprotein diacylglyceryl transferase [bacterium]OQX56872.1 MAG: prolipoprotein diacylglyceryl transferase [candidate division KSB1 bacterium 4484_219]RKY79109.1 MAG: prolipoprotein diacylglyceryl transferase [candidate division KSB1 bacterium]HEC32564.1 prolipoprotein diacylglyceryl transferase [Deltaproteobacteria bacterium]RKY86001.1 MAG: prolipoprotein diacylglyceryl transferase [candidate division KSB1 bacterium]
MHPVLFKIGWFEVHSYGLMLALSFLLGLLLVVRRAKAQKIPVNVVLDIATISVICGVIGSRFFYVIFHLDEFRGNWLDTINPIQSSGEIGIAGLTVIGGFLLALVTITFYLWRKNLPILKITDIFAPSVALGIFLTRIGCFLNGCCFGKPTDSPLGLVFPENSPAGFVFPNIRIHPTQLYSSFYGLVIFIVLLISEKKFKKFDGFTFFLLFILYGIARFTVDFFRYYENSMTLRLGGIAISVNQGVCILLMVGFGALFIYFWHKTPSKQLDKGSDS